jgi:hypothetical protein
VIRSIGGYIGQVGEKHTLGYGLSLGGGYDLGERDHLSFQVNGGQGIGRYLNDLSGRNSDLSASSDGSLSALPAAGGFAALQHRWNRQWRSNAVFGFVRVSNSDAQPASALARSGYSAVNLIWSPDKSLLLGAEYLYGWNAQKGGPRANASRLQLSVMYYLVK